MHELSTQGRTLRLTRGDITEQRVDAIVNAANSRLAGGGGVDGAIHQAAGPSIMNELKQFDGCPAGSAVVTSAGRLQARYIFHAVGPVWQGGHKEEPQTLRKAYAACMEWAEKHKASSIAFPSISTGVYGYPLDKAASIAVQEVWKHLKDSECVTRAVFVLFDAETYAGYEAALRILDENEDRQ